MINMSQNGMGGDQQISNTFSQSVESTKNAEVASEQDGNSNRNHSFINPPGHTHFSGYNNGYQAQSVQDQSLILNGGYSQAPNAQNASYPMQYQPNSMPLLANNQLHLQNMHPSSVNNGEGYLAIQPHSGNLPPQGMAMGMNGVTNNTMLNNPGHINGHAPDVMNQSQSYNALINSRGVNYMNMNNNQPMIMAGQGGGGQLPNQHPMFAYSVPQNLPGNAYNGNNQVLSLSQNAQQHQPTVMSGNSNSAFSSRQAQKAWHNSEHQPERSGIIEEIVKLLKSRRPNATDNWTEKLPHMARKLEDALYHEAESFDFYKDRTTLKNRLQQLAISMGNGRSGSAAGGSNPNPQSLGQVPLNPQNGSIQQAQSIPMNPAQQNRNNPAVGNGNGMNNNNSNNIINGNNRLYSGNAPVYNNNGINIMAGQGQQQPPQAGQQQLQQPLQQQPNGMNFYQPVQGPRGPAMPYIMTNQQQPLQNQPNGFVPGGLTQVDYGNNMVRNNGQGPNNYQTIDNSTGGMTTYNAQSNPMMQQQQQQQQGMPMSQGFVPINQNGNGMVMQLPAPSMMPSLPNQSQMPPQQQMVQNMPGNITLGGGMTSNMPPTNADEHRKQVLKQQQQRLLLLRHASKCPHDNGRCPVTPHCWGMKQLWKHIMSCKDQDCKVPHCVSSRYVLSHYSKCKEPQCPVCGPVRDAIKKNYERSKEVVGIVGGPGGGMQVGTGSLLGKSGVGGHMSGPHSEMGRANKKRRTDNGMNAAGSNGPMLVIPRPMPQSTMGGLSEVTLRKKIPYPLDPISSAIYCLSNEQIGAHIKSIQEGLRLKVSKIREICKPLLDELFRFPGMYEIFGQPVDPAYLGIPDYFEKIKMPMDLGTVNKKLEAGSYRDFDQFAADVKLTFDNATSYNPPRSDVHTLAKNARKSFSENFVYRIREFDASVEEGRHNVDACKICGEYAKLEFAPPVYYCSGTCGKAIKRGAWYYSNNAHTYYWCSSCFTSLRASEVLTLPDCTVTKAELEKNKKQHNETNEEPWVECEGGCERWVHQICSLFNSRRNLSDLPFVCPFCLKKKRDDEPLNPNIVAPITKPMTAEQLPRTVLSDFLEKRIFKRLQIEYEELAYKLGIPVDQVEKCPKLTLRQVSCSDKEQDVREGFLARYGQSNFYQSANATTYPRSFPCRVKCLVLFQNIDGQDVILFGMYVYEYGHKCPAPNQRRVYISYLDSVHYLRPKQYRTLVYHEILISYLDYVKARGFHTAHIWACPPQKGDDYILHIHPPDQKTPRPQTLRIWYDEMLQRCQERGIIVEMNDIHGEYLTEANNDPTILPYFEGDYWVNEAEVIIKNLNEGKKGSAASMAAITQNGETSLNQQNKRKNKSKKAERQNSVGAIVPGSTAIAAVSRHERDPLIAKLSSIIEPMKDTFFVARLHPREYAERCALQLLTERKGLLDKGENGVSGEEEAAKSLQNEALSNEDVVPAMPAVPPLEEKASVDVKPEDARDGSGNGSGDEQEEGNAADDDFAQAAAMIGDEGNISEAAAGLESGGGTVAEQEERKNIEDRMASESPLDGSNETTSANSKNPMARGASTSDLQFVNEKCDEREGSSPTIPVNNNSSNFIDSSVIESKTDEGTDSAPSSYSGSKMMSPSKAIHGQLNSGSSSNIDPGGQSSSSASSAMASYSKRMIKCGEDMPDLPDNTEDVDSTEYNEHFETRQSFLNLCQGNHYQFDQLRRAKHSSMMVLYHLHNPDAPKFVPNCNYCKQSINSATFHCRICEVDYCGDCYGRYGPRLHHHPLQQNGAAPTTVTEEQRRERERSIKLHMQLLTHAANCEKCESKNCARMKEFLAHEMQCSKKAAGGCRVCSRMTNLLHIHARSCRVENCKVPHCLTLREQYRKLQMSQMQMDDRRRQQMNLEYNRGSGNREEETEE